MECLSSFLTPSSYYQFAKHIVTTTIVKLDEVRQDVEAFQKVLIVGRSILQGVNFCRRTPLCPQLILALNEAESFDFHGIYRFPSYFFHSYIPHRLDEYAILDQLEEVLCRNWQLGHPNEQGQSRDPAVFQFAQQELEAFLKHMVDQGSERWTEKEIKQLLADWLVSALRTTPIDSFNPQAINLHDLSIKLKKSSWLDVLIDTTFMVIDVVCVPAFLQDWDLLDLSIYANQVGRLPLLSWIPRQSLNDWIWGAMSVGYFLQFSQACYQLWKGELTSEEATDTKWLVAASLAETIYSLVILQQRDSRLIVFFAFVSKSVGLICFLRAPKPSFFTTPPHA